MSAYPKSHPMLFNDSMVNAILDGRKTQTRRVVRPAKCIQSGCELASSEIAGEVNQGDFTNSKIKPGHSIWVRETWCNEIGAPDEVSYRATAVKDGWTQREFASQKWRPSIFMPRWASRIALIVKSVRIDRINDISEEDALAEGCKRDGWDCARDWYADLWECINGLGAWSKNQFVWVYEFEVRVDESASAALFRRSS